MGWRKACGDPVAYVISDDDSDGLLVWRALWSPMGHTSAPTEAEAIITALEAL